VRQLAQYAVRVLEVEIKQELLEQVMCRKNWRTLIAIACMPCVVCFCNFSAPAEELASKHVPAKLTCGSHSSSPKDHKAFQADIQFDVDGALWLLDWKTEHAEVKFRGILSPSGMMLIAGLGKSDNGATWTYEFSGRKNPTGIAVLKGSLQSEHPKGMRSCSITFEK
jgi:hypothetical protein